MIGGRPRPSVPRKPRISPPVHGYMGISQLAKFSTFCVFKFGLTDTGLKFQLGDTSRTALAAQ